MSEPFWLTRQMVVAIHDEQLTIHGGASGLRDEGMLESALDRPKNKWAYEGAELPELAAAYAFGIARNHPFVDGNKRTSLLALFTFRGCDHDPLPCRRRGQRGEPDALDQGQLAIRMS
jgi:death-on-curing protein